MLSNRRPLVIAVIVVVIAIWVDFKEVSGMTYITAAELLNKFDATEMAQLSDPDLDSVVDAINSAERECNGYLFPRYTSPLLSIQINGSAFA